MHHYSHSTFFARIISTQPGYHCSIVFIFSRASSRQSRHRRSKSTSSPGHYCSNIILVRTSSTQPRYHSSIVFIFARASQQSYHCSRQDIIDAIRISLQHYIHFCQGITAVIASSSLRYYRHNQDITAAVYSQEHFPCLDIIAVASFS